MAKKHDKAYIKKLVSLIVPLVVLAISVSVVGVSYAWFALEGKAEIAPLNLATASVFTLTFEQQSGKDNAFFIGETAYDPGGHLITKAWATDTENGGIGLTEGSAEYLSYMRDKAYSCTNKMKFDTEGRRVEFELNFTDFEIWGKRYDADGGVIGKDKMYSITDDKSDPTYCGTWYLEHLSSGTIYTPYGAMTTAEFNHTDGRRFPFDSLQKSSVKNFVAVGADTYNLCIVFAPEKLFWAQYSSSDWKKTVTDMYTQHVDGEVEKCEMDKICSSANGNNHRDMPFFASPMYTGADFNFKALLSVLSVLELP